MVISFHTIFLATCLLLTAPVASAKPSLSDEPLQIVRSLSDAEVKAFLQRDPKALAAIWSDDFVVTNPLNDLVTKQQVLDMVKSGFLVITSFTRKIEYVQRYGDTVVVAGTEQVTWGGKMPVAGKTNSLRFTAIWVRQKGHWQEVARHANIVPGR
jgi:hypothetical protein